jgi:hypothetical protein
VLSMHPQVRESKKALCERVCAANPSIPFISPAVLRSHLIRVMLLEISTTDPGPGQVRIAGEIPGKLYKDASPVYPSPPQG